MSADFVWRAHHDPDVLPKWLLGPDRLGRADQVVTTVGDSYRYEWEKGANRFGFTGEVLESHAASLLITYPNVELRDTVLATGMSDGMERCYHRLDPRPLPLPEM